MSAGRAELRLVDGIHYRRDAFAEGLSGLGFDVTGPRNDAVKAGDVLVIWNRYQRDEYRAQAYERANGYVLVTENAWLGPEEKDEHLFAICRGHHNGVGTWHVGGADRWTRLGIPLEPWRTEGRHLLILPQRGMGENGVRMPLGWEGAMLASLRSLTDMPIRVQRHPGPRPHPPIDFSDTYAAVTWASGAAIKALVAGIPVFYELRKWIGADAAKFSVNDLANPFLGDRLPMFKRMAWAMWSADEIAKGDPFKWLLRSR